MSTSTSTIRSRHRLPAFTLTEMLVAIGALALLSLGVAQVFSLTTKTVAAGRRLSNLNAVASAVERQMRADFSALTSRGPIVIRNEWANNGQPVEAYPADPSPRRRRIDEIVGFATGSFTSMQQPVTTEGTPVVSSEAMIYFGHGARQDPTSANSSGFDTPVNISDANVAAPRLGEVPAPGGSKVNQYASEWTLVRRAFVMSPPAVNKAWAIPANQGLPAGVTADSAVQIAGLPAVPSASRDESQFWFADSTSYNPPLRGGVPTLASGVVDVIAMDIRSVANQLADVSNNYIGGNASLMDATSQRTALNNALTRSDQQSWLRTLLPADSDAGRRIRVEPAPPDFVNVNGASPTPLQRADQLMLTTGAFLPRCSEFIVEYSFGVSRTSTDGPAADIGAIYWHGLQRNTGFGGPNITDFGLGTVRYEDWVRANRNQSLTQGVRRRLPNKLPAGQGEFRNPPHPVRANLIEPTSIAPWYGGGPGFLFSSTASYALFGINDPTYTPTTTLLAKDVDGDGQYDWKDGDVLQEPEAMPWARPTMLRITFTLNDPTDPSIEQTFQFVFDLPKDTRSPAY